MKRVPRFPSLALGMLFLVGSAMAPTLARSADMTAQQIVDKSLERNAFGFDNALADLTLLLVSKRGSERTREIAITSMERSGLNKTLVRFRSPADVAGTGFLVLENQGEDDDQYLYLPALGKVKRITGSQRNQRFMGTDLTYADLESRNLRKSNSKKLPDAKVGGNDTYVIESTPKDLDDSQYGRTISWIHKTSFVPLKVEFYDKQNRLLKTLDVKRLEKKSGKWVVMDSWIENVQSKTKTRMTVRTINFDVKLSENDFTQRALQEG